MQRGNIFESFEAILNFNCLGSIHTLRGCSLAGSPNVRNKVGLF